jgi:hAT family C-terminal dimerisation region
LADLDKVRGLVQVCCYGKMNTVDLIVTRIIEDHSDDVPSYLVVCKLMLCIPVTSVECERAFSLQNRLKTKLRNRLGEDRVNVLMKLSMGPPIELFDFPTAVRYWKAAKQAFALSVPTRQNTSDRVQKESKCPKR